MTSTALARKKGRQSNSGTGRGSEQVYDRLRSQLLSGEISVGRFLPTEREMAAEHGVAHTTVRRALERLKADGLIRAEPRKGYRVLSLANDPARGCPIAFVRGAPGAPEQWDEFHVGLVRELQSAADRRGWPLLAMGGGSLDPAGILARVKTARASAVIIDTHDQDMIRAVRESGVPAMMVDSWIEGCGLDSVMQDGHHGGMLAARHLHELGCRRIAWFGPDDRSTHELDRFGGFAAGLFGENAMLNPELVFSCPEGGVLEAARRLLSGRGRPEAVVALWSIYATAIKQVADEAGLVLGRDLQMVGWCAEELYDRDYAPGFAGGQVAPAVTWSLRAMADSAMAVLTERWAHPELPPLRVRVPARLRT
ncbi:MAG TPA: GntR family transcriptional regulator [Planctomycetota bacterium]|nr:GntR family transcriptional regulator [Planctomycetota bacterium]